MRRRALAGSTRREKTSGQGAEDLQPENVVWSQPRRGEEEEEMHHF